MNQKHTAKTFSFSGLSQAFLSILQITEKFENYLSYFYFLLKKDKIFNILLSKFSIYLFLGLATLSLTGCEIYGPATRYQNTRMLERPFYDGRDTNQVYISTKFGNGRNYREKDKSYSGELSVHNAWVSKWVYGAVGAYGQYGRYQLRDSAALSYYSTGLRLEGGTSGYFGNTEVGFVALSLSLNYENGDFYRLRQRTPQSNAVSIILFADSTKRAMPRSSLILDFQSHFNIRHRFKTHQILNFQAGLGFSVNDETAMYGFANASYQIDKNYLFNINTAFPITFKNVDNPLNLNNLVSIGLTYGF